MAFLGKVMINLKVMLEATSGHVKVTKDELSKDLNNNKSKVEFHEIGCWRKVI